MQVTVDHQRVFELLDILLPRWKASPKLYPYNRKDAVVPQKIIPAELRADKLALACFYFYVCLYMRGSISSLQAFRSMLEMQEKHPELFIPLYVQGMERKELQETLSGFLGWDSWNAAGNWIENSRRLAQYWDGNPLRLIKGLRDYDEACRRIRNKRLKREIRAAGYDGRGFVGFQEKMVSMLLYFYDWEGWLTPRFLYPSPADFHNFRMGISSGAITYELVEGENLKPDKYLSPPWRDAIMAYLKQRKADPVEVADALWLFSLVMCGNSPATATKKNPLKKRRDKDGKEVETLLTKTETTEEWDPLEWAGRKSLVLQHTCLVCPFSVGCIPVPARPYYDEGHLVRREPLRLEVNLGSEHLNDQVIDLRDLAEEQHDFGFPIAKKPAATP